jgi:hypothetical protein
VTLLPAVGSASLAFRRQALGVQCSVRIYEASAAGKFTFVEALRRRKAYREKLGQTFPRGIEAFERPVGDRGRREDMPHVLTIFG